MITELQRAVSLRVPYMGDAEFQVACLRAEKKSESAIVVAIEAHRKSFAEGKTSSIGSASFASADSWKAIAKESDKAARAILLEHSSELNELNRLEKAAAESQKAAAAKEAELNALWNESNALPDKIDALNLRLSTIKNGLKELEPEKLRAEFKSHFKAILNGASGDQMAQLYIAAAIVTADLRKEVLEEAASEAEEKLVALRKRSKDLSRKLGR